MPPIRAQSDFFRAASFGVLGSVRNRPFQVTTACGPVDLGATLCGQAGATGYGELVAFSYGEFGGFWHIGAMLGSEHLGQSRNVSKADAFREPFWPR